MGKETENQGIETIAKTVSMDKMHLNAEMAGSLVLFLKNNKTKQEWFGSLGSLSKENQEPIRETKPKQAFPFRLLKMPNSPYQPGAETFAMPESVPQQPKCTPAQALNALPLRLKGVAGCL